MVYGLHCHLEELPDDGGSTLTPVWMVPIAVLAVVVVITIVCVTFVIVYVISTWKCKTSDVSQIAFP